MIAIDDLAYRSKLAKADPRGKLWFSLLPLMVCIASKSMLVSFCTLLIMSAASLYYGAVDLKRYLHLLMVPGAFLLLGTLTIIVGRIPAGTEMLLGFQAGENTYGVTAESLCRGGGLILRALGAVSCMYFLSLNTPMNALFGVLEKSPLPRVIVSLIQLIYRYIFVIWEEAAVMRIAQQSRLGYRSFKTSMISTGTLAATLFIRAYQRVDRAQAALESRGYREGCLDTLEEVYRPCKGFYWAAGGATFLLIGLETAYRLLF